MEEQQVTFELEGQQFITIPSVIKRSEFLTNMINRNWKENPSQVIVINRSARLFMDILEHLNNRSFKLSNNCREELKYYSIDYTEDDIEPSVSELMKKIDQLKISQVCKSCEEEFSSQVYTMCPFCVLEGWNTKCRVRIKNKGLVSLKDIVIGDEVFCFDLTHNRPNISSTIISIYHSIDQNTWPVPNQNIQVSAGLMIVFRRKISAIPKRMLDVTPVNMTVINFCLNKIKTVTLYHPTDDNKAIIVKTY